MVLCNFGVFVFLCYLQLFLLAFVRSGFGMEDQSQIFKLRYRKGKSVYDVTHWFMYSITSSIRSTMEN